MLPCTWPPYSLAPPTLVRGPIAHLSMRSRMRRTMPAFGSPLDTLSRSSFLSDTRRRSSTSGTCGRIRVLMLGLGTVVGLLLPQADDLGHLAGDGAWRAKLTRAPDHPHLHGARKQARRLPTMRRPGQPPCLAGQRAACRRPSSSSKGARLVAVLLYRQPPCAHLPAPRLGDG